MAQYSVDQDFQRMTIHDPRKQLSPTIARKPQISGSVYRAGPAPYRSYEDRQEDLPPPPPSQSYLDNYPVPPPPPDPKENIYHEITDDFSPPPPTEAPPTEVYRSPEPVHARSSSGFNQTSYGGPGGQSYETRHESHTLVQPSGRYEREVKQATYSIQSSDSSGRSSPYGSSSHYGNLNTYSTSHMINNPPPPPTQPYLSSCSGRSSPYGSSSHYGNLNTYSTSNMINNPPPPPTQPYLSSSEAQPYSTTSLYDTSGQYGSPNSARQYQDSHVTYAQIQSKQEPSGGVTYAQIAPKSDRPVPGPQVPIQIKVSDSRRGEPEPSGQVQYQASSLSKTGNQYSKYSPGQQYSTSSTGKQYSASPIDQQYGTSGPGPQYAGSNPGPQYSSNGPGNQYSSNPGPQYSTSQGSRYSGGQMSQYSSPGPGQQYSSNPGPQYSTGPNYSGAQYAGSSPGPQYASSGPGPQYSSSGPGPQYAGSNPGPQYSGSPSTMYSQSKPAYGSSDNKSSNSKEEEVDALTQMLMQGLEGTKEPDFYGICTKCGKKVVGETNGCTAMDQVYHIACFICVGCGKLLRGESFYAMERKPFCEICYVNSLEKCSVCSKPITDRLLRATGKPYHPACFTCVVCGKSLDGIPFTVDATNQIHCIECFHSKFAPRCCVCYNPIMPEKGQEETVRVVAMDRSFHVGCYRCEDCHTQLSSEAEGRGCYPLDDHILCKNCNAKRINALTTKLSTEL